MGNDASKETDQQQQQQPRQTREQRAAAKAQKAIGSQKQQMDSSPPRLGWITHLAGYATIRNLTGPR